MVSQQRRRLLQFLLAGAAIPSPAASAFWFSGDKEDEDKKQIRSHKGSVIVNGRGLDEATIIRPGDTIETGENSEIVFTLGKDAHLLRSNTRMTFQNDNDLAGVMRLISGAVLSVFGSGRKSIITPIATIGIRGTGTYFEVSDNDTYLCTCYGETEINANDDPAVNDRVSTKHHEAPRTIRRSAEGVSIQEAKVRNHTDSELIMLEATVGREPPFADDPFFKDDYIG